MARAGQDTTQPGYKNSPNFSSRLPEPSYAHVQLMAKEETKVKSRCGRFSTIDKRPLSSGQLGANLLSATFNSQGQLAFSGWKRAGKQFQQPGKSSLRLPRESQLEAAWAEPFSYSLSHPPGVFSAKAGTKPASSVTQTPHSYQILVVAKAIGQSCSDHIW